MGRALINDAHLWSVIKKNKYREDNNDYQPETCEFNDTEHVNETSASDSEKDE